jgi:hypothetical protein
MKKILITAALLMIPFAALAQGYNTTGGYGNALLNSRGAMYIDQDSLKPTYSYTASDITPVATATDVITISGSASKVIRIKSVCLGGVATAASVYDLYIYKRTTANTGGTSTNPTPVQFDSNDAAPSATVSLYTANATLGTGVLVSGGHIALVNATTPAAQLLQNCWEFGRGEEKPTLRGVAQSLAIGHGGGAVPSGANIYYTVQWTED